MVKTDQQQYFFVGERTARRSQPVTKSYIADRVRKTSLRVLGGVITPSDLRRTAADIVAKRSKRRGAILTVMGYSRLTAIRFNYLEQFPLQPKTPAPITNLVVAREEGDVQLLRLQCEAVFQVALRLKYL